MNVPLLDLTQQYRSLAEELRAAVMGVIEEQRFILGPAVDRLEEEVARYLGVPHAIGCASGTDALLLSLRAFDVAPGDEVVTSPFTFFATAGAIHNVGARPVFADIRPDTFNLDPAAAAAVVGERTRVVVPVHLFGQMADMTAFRALADRAGVALVEDAAQSIGARRRIDGTWRRAGEAADIGTFSFLTSKKLGGYGDGGMMVTQDEALYRRLMRLRTHGSVKTYYHEEVGYNSRLDALQAAVLLAKLPHLEGWSEARRANARFYDAAFADVPELTTPVVDPEAESIYNQYTLRCERRDELQAHLKAHGIGAAVYYPLPLHLQPCFAYLGYQPGSCPEAERAAGEVLSLPVYPELTAAQRDEVIATVRGFYGR